MTTKPRLSITRLVAATADVGYCQPPGGGQAEKTCTIIARRDGRWEVTGEVKTGGNQGYFQVDYEYGPWTGRGDTPQAAVAAMVRRADDEYQADMRRAGHDALLECEGKTFAALARAEADRIAAVAGPTRVVRIGDQRFHGLDEAAQAELRTRAATHLRRLAGGAPDLSDISDGDLLAECQRRGLTV